MSNRAATSRNAWALLLALSVVSCGDGEQDTPSQVAAGAAARGRAEAGSESGTTGNESHGASGASGAAGSGGTGGMARLGEGAAGSATLPMMDDGSTNWSTIYQFVFWSCSNESCHGTGLAGVNFATKDAAWQSLINQPANPAYACAKLGKQRVVPGDPDNSLLYLKLDINSPCGQQMPPGGLLSDQKRERVRAWIMAGAKND